jgi:hypothetical protein
MSLLRKSELAMRHGFKSVLSRLRHRDALPIKDALLRQLDTLLGHHDLAVELHRWQWTIMHDVRWGGSFTVMIYQNGECLCGMSFDLVGIYLVISQIHGVKIHRCRLRPMRRFWQVTLVRAAHDLGYKTLLIRAERSNSWPHATPEIRERLVKHLDCTACALGLKAWGSYWIWE